MERFLQFDITNIYTIVCKTEKPGFHFQNLCREWDGFVLFTEGKAFFSYHGKEAIRLSAGDIVLLRKNDNYCFDSQGGCSYCASAFDFSKDSENMLKGLPVTMHCTPYQSNSVIIMERLWQNKIRESYMICKTELFRLYLDFIKSNPNNNILYPGNKVIRRAVEFIHTNFKRNFTADEISEYCSISKSYLRAKFIAETGMSIIEYRNELRLNTAKELLSGGIFSVKETAYELGFCDVYHFTKFFSSHTGISPAKYIKKSQT